MKKLGKLHRNQPQSIQNVDARRTIGRHMSAVSRRSPMFADASRVHVSGKDMLAAAEETVLKTLVVHK